jgi:flagellar basal-body rod modification protein FlgD
MAASIFVFRENPMEIQANTSASTPPAPRGAPAITSDFTTFLKMLTTQMQNQDPLNPLDSTDFAVQLATFSGVEQQVRTNQLLLDLSSQFGLSGIGQYASWIGQEARSPAPVVFQGAPVTIHAPIDSAADSAVLTVTDAAGNLLARETLPPGRGPFTWFGADARGEPLPPGTYRLGVESLRGGEVIATSAVQSFSRVEEVRKEGENVLLLLQGGATIPASDVTALRRP